MKSYDYSLTIGVYKNTNIKPVAITTFEEINTVSKNLDDAYMAIQGINHSYPSFISSVSNARNEAKLIKGKGFSAFDIKEGKPKVIITKQCADTNELEVGSFLSLDQNCLNQ
ncbi:MAG: hypothetical protein ACK5KR_05015 [Breznakia sp.]